MPTEKRATRKLRAIFSADVKGYSILMADDEVFTIKTIKEYREIMFNCIEQYAGRVGFFYLRDNMKKPLEKERQPLGLTQMVLKPMPSLDIYFVCLINQN